MITIFVLPVRKKIRLRLRNTQVFTGTGVHVNISTTLKKNKTLLAQGSFENLHQNVFKLLRRELISTDLFSSIAPV